MTLQQLTKLLKSALRRLVGYAPTVEYSGYYRHDAADRKGY